MTAATRNSQPSRLKPVNTSETEASLDALDWLDHLIRNASDHIDSGLLHHDVVATVTMGQTRLPLHVIQLGSSSPDVPAVGYFGGIHGVERIGTEVVITFLQSLIDRLRWDADLQHFLNRIRLVFMPLVNPVGMLRKTRSNGNQVDLMRNAPVDAIKRPPFLLGGQRMTRHLPWYRGKKKNAMEIESQALCDVVEQRLFNSPMAISLDCHSGFGARDRIWFPYAKSVEPIPHLAEMFTLRNLFRSAYPNHSYYTIEPQSFAYTTHGDLWDYLYDRRNQQQNGMLLPLTLEMGSWLWIRKNPLQVFNRLGLFHPLTPHRHQRILRQHLLLLEFVMRAAANYQHWLPDEDSRREVFEAAQNYWRPHI